MSIRIENTINEYAETKGYSGVEDKSSQKHKFATEGEMEVIDYLVENGFAVTFIKRGYKDDIIIQKDNISMTTVFRACLSRGEYRRICPRFTTDFSQYRELVALREQYYEGNKQNGYA